MNSHCGICEMEAECGYEYKPCDCCNYRKFRPKTAEQRERELASRPRAKVIPFPSTTKTKGELL